MVMKSSLPKKQVLALGVFMGLGPLLLSAVVGGVYGSWWALPELIILYVLTFCLAFVRNPTWPRRHPAWAFALGLTGIAAVLFVVVAFVVAQLGGPPAKVPAWGSFAITLGLSTVATALLWPAQRRYYESGSRLM